MAPGIGSSGAEALKREPLAAHGVFEAVVPVAVAADARELAARSDFIVIAVPMNAHRAVMDALLPHVEARHRVLVSSMGSLSSLYLFEAAKRRGVELLVGSLGTTTLTARRDGPARVRVMTRRQTMGLSALPVSRSDEMLGVCRAFFGDVFVTQQDALASALSNINPAAHGPLALFNWTRIERAENWPQYHYMTPQVAGVIERLEAERLALARAFGVEVRTIERHFAESFGVQSTRLADIAAELHAKRGGPPGPTDVQTRFITEDVPFGLVFAAALGRVAEVATPATDTIVAAASLLTGRDWSAANDLIEPLGLERETVAGLQRRVRAS
ncbi:MAG: NAD/NADP octopine/nopaline dehydrogenase family protein [Rubrivivax sp.]